MGFCSRSFEIAPCVAQMSKDPISNLVEPIDESMQFNYEESEMTTTDSINKKPILYWIMLAIMFTAFFAVVSS